MEQNCFLPDSNRLIHVYAVIIKVVTNTDKLNGSTKTSRQYHISNVNRENKEWRSDFHEKKKSSTT